jgi:hypothetical protein
MKTYLVTMPITGAITLEVEAENEEDALEAFWSKADTMRAEDLHADMDWEYTPHVTEGNVTHAHTNDLDIEEV